MSRLDGFLDALHKLAVTTESPDGSVRMRLSNSDGLSVAVDPRVYQGHTDASLSEQATAAVRGIQTGYRKGFDKIVGSFSQRPRKPHRLDPDSVGGRRQVRLHNELSTLEIRVASPRGQVRVRMTAVPDAATVEILPGTMQRMALPPEQLAEEIRSALVTAKRDLDAKKDPIVEAVRADAPIEVASSP
ncbi:MAG: hypothetical protein ACRD0P_05545 [Stackebrandtia sp.]